MNEKEIYDVSEVANELQISTQAVYKRMKSKKFEKYVVEKDGKKHISKAGFEILKAGKQVQEKNKNSEEIEKQVANLIGQIANQKKEIEELKRVVSELQTKVEKQQSEVSVRLLDVLENQQKLQAMQMQQQTPKKSLFQRLLGGE